MAELSLQPLKLSPSSSDSCYARLNSTIVAVGSEIYQIGGTVKDKRSKAVFVLDCWTHTWRRGPNLTVARKHAKSCLLDGKIYVIGGCRKREQPMNWAEVFDLKTQTWNPLASPSDDNGSHQVLVLGARLYVITQKNNDKFAYDPKQGRWVLEFGFVGLQLITTGPWCVIDNIVFHEYCDKYWWYDLSCGMWLMVEGLADLYINHAHNNRTIQLVNYGGKLLVIWRESIELQHPTLQRPLGILQKRTCCAVIRLEKRLTCLGTQIWGESERLNDVVIRVPKSYNKLLSCISVSV